MRSSALIAGVDIGNTTTEIVLADLTDVAATPVTHGSVLTAGRKGSPSSVTAAWRLLDRLERSSGRRCERIAIAEAIPVQTGIRSFVGAVPRPTRLVSLDVGNGDTRSGAGVAVGRPVLLADLARAAPEDPSGAIVALVTAGTDFETAAAGINAAVRAGRRIVGVLVGGDEAVLVGNRLETTLPVIDEVAVEQATRADRVILEVVPDGAAPRALADPMALADALDLPADLLAEAEQIAHDHVDVRSGAIAFLSSELSPEPDGSAAAAASAWIEFLAADGARRRLPIAGNYAEVARCVAPGSVRALCLPRPGRSATALGPVDVEVRDFFAPDLPTILARPLVRRGELVLEKVPAALLRGEGRHDEARALLAELSGRPVVVAAAEPPAARLGALTTPAAPASAAVCDVGGGSIDLVDGDRSVTAAGAGELLTLAVAAAAGIPRGTAERVKRHRSFRVESPSLVHDEDGRRRFAEPAAVSRYVGRLCVDTGRAVVPFSDRLSPEEWRGLRLTLKVETLGVNMERALRALGSTSRQLVLCGGCALDDELVRAAADGLRAERILVGRANVAGTLGPRYAVALGLILCCAERE